MTGSRIFYEQSKLGEAFNHFLNTCQNESVLDDKTSELIQVALAGAFRCPHCTETHIKKALDVGATKQEVSEALLLAALEGAGTQLAWQKETFQKYLGEESQK